MQSLRHFATRHARAYEVVYNGSSPIILAFIRLMKKLFGDRLDGAFTWAEKQSKELLFDCRMCGNCVLSSTGMTCPMNCPKTIRNGPCGGVRANGHCEVKPEMKCVWVEAWSGSRKMKNSHEIEIIQFAPNNKHKGTSAWIRLAEQKQAEKEQARIADGGQS